MQNHGEPNIDSMRTAQITLKITKTVLGVLAGYPVAPRRRIYPPSPYVKM